MHMFDWVFFGIVVPTPTLLLLDLYLNRKDAQRGRSALVDGGLTRWEMR